MGAAFDTGKSTAKGLVLLAALVGMLAGIGGFTFLYAEGLSYMSSDPKACVNCHIMQPQYEGWQKASHHAVATCVDCHLPHSFVRKWIAKGVSGFHDSKAFTFQDFHEPIMIGPAMSRILQESCLHCHAALVHDLVPQPGNEADEVRCVHCHRAVGHGATTGLGR